MQMKTSNNVEPLNAAFYIMLGASRIRAAPFRAFNALVEEVRLKYDSDEPHKQGSAADRVDFISHLRRK